MGNLSEEREFVRRSLDDLEREWAAGELAEADYEALRRRYEAKAAALEAGVVGAGVVPTTAGAAAAGAAAGAAGAAGAGAAATATATAAGAGAAAGAAVGAAVSKRSVLRPLAWGAAVVALAVAAGLVVASASGDRLPGDPASGSITATGASDTLARARDLIGQGQAPEAIKLYDQVLEDDPANAEALAYRGWLVRLVGKQAGDARLVDKGFDYVNRAVEADPNYPDARFFKGLILFQDKNDPAAAVPELRAFLGLDPPAELVPLVEDVLRRAMEAMG